MGPQIHMGGPRNFLTLQALFEELLFKSAAIMMLQLRCWVSRRLDSKSNRFPNPSFWVWILPPPRYGWVSIYSHISLYIHMGVVQYSFISSWGLAPRLRGACASLRVRTVWLTMVSRRLITLKLNTMSVFKPLRQPCAELVRAGFLTNYVTLGFRLSKIVDKGFRTTLIYILYMRSSIH